MDLPENAITVDFEKLIEFIRLETGFNKEIIEKVLDLETLYMEKLGIITTKRQYIISADGQPLALIFLRRW